MKLRYFLFLLITFSCANSSSTDKEYKKVLTFFDNNIVSHFPSHIPHKYSLEYDTIGYFNTYSISLATNMDKQVKKEINSHRQDIFNINDSCILVVNDFIDVDNAINPKTYQGESQYNKDCYNFNIIPNFWNSDYYSKKTKSKLDSNFEYIVLESKTGIFDSHIIDSISFMPCKYRHGYSKGYAIDKANDKIIYWSVIW